MKKMIRRLPMAGRGDGNERRLLELLLENSDGVNGQKDAFSRTRVSNPTTIFDSQSQFDAGIVDNWYHKITGSASAAHDHDKASVTLTTTTGGTDAIIRQTQRYFRYQPGKSQLIFITFDYMTDDGGTKEAWYGDDDNGIGFRRAADGTLSFIKRSKQSGSVVDEVIPQEKWNVDRFITGNELNHSNIHLKALKSQILVIDLQWLATGRVRIGFDIDGELHYGHHFKWANENNGVYMSTANLPVRYKLTGNGNVTNMECICTAVISEGGFTADLGHEHVTPNILPKSCPVTVATPIISIRPKALFKTYTNRGTYVPTAISFYTQTNPVLVQNWHGGTLTGASFASADAESGIDYDVAATAIANGHLTTSEFGAAASGGKAFSSAGQSETQNKIFLTLDIDGAVIDNGNYTITGTGLGGTAVVYMNIHWAEIK
jgi:hypothetical protein